VTPEEWLYPQVQEALTAWTMAHRSRHVVYRIVGERWSARSHDLRDMLTNNGVPFEFHAVESPEGRQLMSPQRSSRQRSIRAVARGNATPPGAASRRSYGEADR
jgi:thioredoxin reductase (NADPH)